MARIPIAGPWITDKEVAYVTDAAANAWYDQAGKYHGRFETAFADYLGVAHAVALPSCTSALHLALAALGVGPGDEVIVPDITWIATGAAVTYLGATPVFADVNRHNWCLSPESFEAGITDKTKAVIPVDLYGNLPHWDQILEIARHHGVMVIEDAAEAIGSMYKGKHAGSIGSIGTFSFHGSKTMTTGEGGMLVTNNTEHYHRVLFLRDHGRVPGDNSFFHSEVAFKYKMSAMQAAIGLAQTERLDELVQRKREIFAWYQHRLGNIEGLVLNPENEGDRNSYWMVTALLDSGFDLEKEGLADLLAQHEIDTRPFFHPLSSLPAFNDFASAVDAKSRNPIAYELARTGINLPSALNLTREQVDFVCDCLQDILKESVCSAANKVSPINSA